MALVLLGAIGGGAYFGFDRIQNYFVTPDYEGPGPGEALVEVKTGDVAHRHRQHPVRRRRGEEHQGVRRGRRRELAQQEHPGGPYKLRKQMKAAGAVTPMLDPKNRVVNGVTIPEGTITLNIYQMLSEKTKIPVKEFEAAAKDPDALGVPEFWFKRDDGKKGAKSIEGFLYPATYEIPPKATAERS